MGSRVPKDLQAAWNEKLKASGFNDIEDSKQRLKTQDTRYIKYQHKEYILDFFLTMGHYLHHTEDPIRPNDRKILEHYVEGLPYPQIAQLVGCSLRKVKLTIQTFKPIILKLMRDGG